MCANTHTWYPVNAAKGSDDSRACHVPTSYIIVGDNIDKTVNPRYMTEEHQRQSLHYFHSYAVLDRVSSATLPDDSPAGSTKSLLPSTFLPDPDDCVQLRKHFATLIGRVLVDEVPYFKIFKDCVARHIPHKHSDKMSQKSEIVRFVRLISECSLVVGC